MSRIHISEDVSFQENIALVVVLAVLAAFIIIVLMARPSGQNFIYAILVVAGLCLVLMLKSTASD